MAVLVPLGLLTAFVMVVVTTIRRLLPSGRRRARERAAAREAAAARGGGPFGGPFGGAAPARGGSSEREEALCAFVRAMALDDVFTAEDASQAAVISVDGAGAADYLKEARSRGWIEARGDSLTVTDRGRREATAYLAARGL